MENEMQLLKYLCACIQSDMVFESHDCHNIIIVIFAQYVKVTKKFLSAQINFTQYFTDDSYMYQYESFFPYKKFSLLGVHISLVTLSYSLHFW